MAFGIEQSVCPLSQYSVYFVSCEPFQPQPMAAPGLIIMATWPQGPGPALSQYQPSDQQCTERERVLRKRKIIYWCPLSEWINKKRVTWNWIHISISSFPDIIMKFNSSISTIYIFPEYSNLIKRSCVVQFSDCIFE